MSTNKSAAIRPVLKRGQFTEAPDTEVDYEFESPSQFFGHELNLVPAMSSVTAQRSFYTSKFFNQALPIHNGEAPLVQTLKDPKTGETFEEAIGPKMGAVIADDDDDGSTIVDVKPDYIKYKNKNGEEKTKNLYNNFAFNRKSVTGDTIVTIKRKNEVQETIKISDYTPGQDDYIWSIDTETYCGSWKKINGFLKHKNDKKLYKVYYKSGRTVSVTEDHSLITLNENAELVPILPKDVKLGYTRSPVVLSPSTNKIIKNTSYYWGVLAGLYLAEGCITNSNTICIAVKPKNRQQEIINLVRYLSNNKIYVYITSERVSFSDFLISSWLKAFCGQKSGNKFISDSIYTESSAFKLGLINGYMSGDGCLWLDTNNTIQLTAVTTSITLRDGLVKVLSSLGVFCTLFDAPRTYINENWNNGFGFRISNSFINKLDKWFFYKDREDKLLSFKKDIYRNSTFEMFNISDELIKSLYKDAKNCGISYKDKNKLYHARESGNVSKNALLDLGFITNRRLMNICKSNTCWDPIMEIKEIEHEDYVYDFCVEDSEMFAVNGGLIVHNTFLTNLPLVKPGDTIKKGQLLARSNYTNDKGVFNMGLNARIAIVPYKGWSYEDGVVISEDFAKKLASEHMYSFSQDFQSAADKKQTVTGKDHFASLFPKKFDTEKLKNINDDGVVKVGTIVKQGDPLILATKPRMVSSKDSELGRLSKYLGRTRTDASLKWEHEADGVVTDVVKTKNGWKVNVASIQPARPGDKVSIGRSGSKGTITKIIPQNLVPRTIDGKPVDVLFNPLGIPSRVNANLIYAMMLGKIAEKTGKTIKVPAFGKSTDKKWYDYVSELMKENGVTDTEPLYDPEKDRILDQPVTVGTDYIIKMHHTAESKYSARGLGSYSSDLQPLKGGTEGSFSKRFSGLEAGGLLSAGAYEFIKDAIHLRGQRNDDYWRAVRNGETPSLAKKSPFVWDKYLALMQGAGINTLQKPNGVLQASPFTDKQFEALNPKELENPYIVDLKTMKPVEGGLFDPANSLTGRWGKITLNEPYPNPGFEDAIASLLNIRKQDMYKIMTGAEQLGKFGTGTKALQKALASIDMEKMFNEAKEQFKHGPKSSKQKALNKMKYIKGLEKNELTPDALMITRIPVIPAKFRPYSAMGDTFIPGDVNELYKDVYQMRDAQKELQQELGEKEAIANSLNMYNSIKALYGFGESMNKKLKQRGVSGFMNKLVGGTSKFSFLNRSVTSTPDDFTGRSVIDVDPDLGMDEVGLPIKMAFTMFAPYIQQRLVQQGMNPAEAIKAVENKTDAAKKALENIVESRYVTISRAPAWHKYNMIGAKVKLHDSNNITVSPLYTKGMGADFDGDFQLGHVYMLIKKS